VTPCAERAREAAAFCFLGKLQVMGIQMVDGIVEQVYHERFLSH